MLRNNLYQSTNGLVLIDLGRYLISKLKTIIIIYMYLQKNNLILIIVTNPMYEAFKALKCNYQA
jgi:hypothetical protein